MTALEELIVNAAAAPLEDVKQALKIIRNEPLEEEMLTTREVCERLKCDRTLLNKHGVRPSFKLAGSNRYYLSEVMKKLKRNTETC